jgi:hypothetical protein
VSKTRRAKREGEFDNYPTPEWPIRRFLEEWPDLKEVGLRWVEPCAGDGAIIDVVNQYRQGVDWTAVDVRDTRPALRQCGVDPDQIRIGDFFEIYRVPKAGTVYQKPFDVAIFNPPFGLTMRFVQRCMELASVVVLLQRINYCGSADRNDFFRTCAPDKYVIPDRVSFTGDGRADGLEHSWHVWGPHPSVAVAEYRVLRTTPVEERRAGRRRVVRARDERHVALASLFEEVAGDLVV